MIALSSFRSHVGELEYARNQKLAKSTWDQCFYKIVYFAPANEPELSGYKTQFIVSEEFPHIKTLAGFAAERAGFSAILNADLVLDRRIMQLEELMRAKGSPCASSRRWQFDVTDGTLEEMTANAQLGDDRGRDIFIANHRVWRKALDEIPDCLRIGNPPWDAWMTDFFRKYWDRHFLDFSAMRVVFHPRHEGRHYPYAEQIAKEYPR